MTWNGTDEADVYEIWCSTSENGEYTLLAATTNTTATHESVTAGNTYYKVVAVKNGVRSKDSNVAIFTAAVHAPVVMVTNRTSDGKIIVN